MSFNIDWKYEFVTPEEIVSCLNEMIDLYDVMIENKFTTFKNGQIYRIGSGICDNLSSCMYKKHVLSTLPKQYHCAIKKWMDVQNVKDLSYWVEGYDEYVDSRFRRMANPKRLEAMIFIRDELLKGD